MTKPAVCTQINAHYSNLEIVINNTERHIIQLHSCKAGEIKKQTHPATRKNRLAAATFFDGHFIQQLGENYFILWRLKRRFRQEQLNVCSNQTHIGIANFWYQCWATHGVIEMTKKKCQRFIALHNNQFVAGNSIEACENRIVMYIYSKDGKDFDLTINGKKPKRWQECHQEKKNDTLRIRNKQQIKYENHVSINQYNEQKNDTLRIKNKQQIKYENHVSISQYNQQKKCENHKDNIGNKRKFEQLEIDTINATINKLQQQNTIIYNLEQQNQILKILLNASSTFIEEKNQLIYGLQTRIQELTTIYEPSVKRQRLNHE